MNYVIDLMCRNKKVDMNNAMCTHTALWVQFIKSSAMNIKQ